MEQRKRTTNIRWGIFPIFGSIRVGAGSARVELFVLCALVNSIWSNTAPTVVRSDRLWATAPSRRNVMEGASAQAAAEDLDLASVGSHSDAGGSSGSRPGSTATTDAVLSEVLHMMQQLSAQVTDQGDQLKGLQKRASEGDRGPPPARYR